MFTIKANRWVTVALLATTGLLTLAPMAQAGRGHGHGRRYKSQYRVVHQACNPYPAQSVYARQSSGAGPALAGLIGGFILGTAVAHASDRTYHSAPVGSYRYYDPSCNQSWSSLDECRLHFRDHRGSSRVIRVIEVSSGDCVRTVRYDGNNWNDYDDDRDDEQYGYRH